MRVLLFIIVMMVLLVACSSNSSSTTTPTLTGTIDITFPQDGATIYSEILFVSGTYSQFADSRFQIEVVTPDGEVIIRSNVFIEADTSEWQVEIPHGYTGSASEVHVRAIPVNGAADAIFDEVSLTLAGSTLRPADLRGSITSPQTNSTINGDTIRVMGTASGLPDNQFILRLVGEDGATLDQHEMTVFNPYWIDEVLWTANIIPGEYTGSAQIQMITSSDDKSLLIDSVTIDISN
ncbi:MAG: hypothetical protein D6737_12265 [Chloroflexi bacterium]|nr:MAG: hypothetical protein CUN54_01605 [Phototrophicales bacterium]RMF79195.1 MAG: hypothetical protein D6737_12265 [Chloroflexota bacterium]